MTETGIDTLAIALVDRYLVGEELGGVPAPRCTGSATPGSFGS